MVSAIDDILRQARQGSVSAIIQVLNEQLSDSGVRTRAILADGVLQLLCEAQTPEQLEQTILVERIRNSLESIQPRHIRRININSRIVREQQLLWLDEITRDPKNQLLWSQQITLKRINPVRRWLEDLRTSSADASVATLPKTSPRQPADNRQFVRGIIGGASLSLLLVLVGWGISDWLGLDLGGQIQAFTQRNLIPPEDESAIAPVATPTPAATPAQPDPFVQAVRLAEQAVRDGQTAQTTAEWLDLATRWQRASDLMSQVDEGDNRYTTAQNRVSLYRQNSESALAMVELLRVQAGGEPAPPTPTP